MKRNSEQSIRHVILATGISSVVTQLLTIRESLTQFQGNEIIIALILFNWLVLGGIGTLAARLAARGTIRVSVERLAWLSLLIAALPVIQIGAIRMLRDIVFIHGVSVGFYPTLAYTFFLITPYCLLIGFVLPYSLFALRLEDPDYPGARVYILDNFGDITGGALFSFLLVFFCTPLQSIVLASALLLAAAVRLFVPPRIRRPGVVFGTLATAAVLLTGIYYETASLEPLEGQLVYYRESPYGRIIVQKDNRQYTLFEGGVPVFSNQNLITAEEAVHYPLSQIQRPRTILLLSSEGGVMQELAKYNLEHIDYLELDPNVTAVLQRFGLIQPVPNLQIFHRDGRSYLANSKQRYDAILVNLPEPETFQINRFFTDRFYQMARDHLNPGGVLSFSVAGYDNYLAEHQRQKVSSLYNTARNHFAHILMLPGQKIYFICRNVPVDPDIPARLAAKNIKTDYIDGFYYGNLTEQRIQGLNSLVDPDTPRNYDLMPHLMRMMFAQWFAKFSTSPHIFIGALLLGILAYLLRVRREEFVLFSTGWMTMGSEILVIFAFQVFFGYIYFQIGVIITVFLAGLLPGAYLGYRFARRQIPMLLLTDGLLILLLLGFIVTLGLAGDRIPSAFFLLFGFAVSLACGFQFPVALHLKKDNDPAAIRFFSADLMGAACGTLFTSLLMIPYLGLYWTTVSLIGLKLFSILILGATYARINAKAISVL